MKSPVYKAAIDYSVEVLKAIRESGCEMDCVLEQFVNTSIRIGAELTGAEVSLDHNDLLQSYEEAKMNAYRSIYLSDILSQLEDYRTIPFETLRKQCEDLHDKLMMLIDNISK